MNQLYKFTPLQVLQVHTTVCEGKRQRKIKLNPDFYMASSQIIDIRVATKLHEL